MKNKCKDEDAYIKKEHMDIIVSVVETEVCDGGFRAELIVVSLSLHYGQRFVGIYSGVFNMGTGDKPIL